MRYIEEDHTDQIQVWNIPVGTKILCKDGQIVEIVSHKNGITHLRMKNGKIDSMLGSVWKDLSDVET